MSSVLERISLTKTDLLSIEKDIRFHEHLRRYAAVRRFCYGKVLDFACGCGYGSFILAANPEIQKVIGIDKDAASIDSASREFDSAKNEFRCQDIETFAEPVDTLVSLEAIEHFSDTSLLPRLVERCRIPHLIISFPDKKSTHFNHFHAVDYTVSQVVALFPQHLCYHRFRMGDVQFLQFVQVPAGAPAHIFANLHDLRD